MKLWQALKKLEENPEKVFESNLAGVEYKVSLDGESIAFESSAGKYTALNNNRNWQEVKQSATCSGNILKDRVCPRAIYEPTTGTWYIED